MKQPHILLITTDQQRGDCLGINSHPVISTPNLDYLGRSGSNFPHAYSEVPSCIGARRTMLSGMEPAHHGMVGYRDGIGWELPHALPNELAQAGYQTELVGKLHMYPHRKRYGFQHMAWADSPAARNDYTDWLADNGATAIEAGLAHGVSANGWVGRPFHLPEELSHTNWCAREAVRFLERRDPSQPFFLWVSFFAPHPPLTPPRDYFDRYMSLDLPEPVLGDWAPRITEPVKGLSPDASVVCLDRETMRRCRAAYYGLINHVDDQIGRILRALRPFLADTLILFTSDHGEMLGDHHLFRKCFAYEGSARVPFFVKAPAWMDCRSGSEIEAVVGLQDLMPTILDAAAVAIPPSVDGRSVLSLMRGEGAAWRDYLHGEHTGCYLPEQGMHYLTDGQEKYIWYTQTGEEQLFDLRHDPTEEHNLARDDSAAGRVERWRRRLVAELAGRPEGFSDGQRLVVGRPQLTVLEPAPLPRRQPASL